VGSLQVRNVATIGGNISNGLPSADTACPLLVFDTQAKIGGPLGERVLPLDQFFIEPGKTALHPDECFFSLSCLHLPKFGSTYWKLGRRQAMEIAMLGIAIAYS
jgi:CO/xanthine dehydrogenase FAD-binding subunit